MIKEQAQGNYPKCCSELREGQKLPPTQKKKKKKDNLAKKAENNRMTIIQEKYNL